MRSVLRVLLWYCFTIDLYKLRKYIWLVVLDRYNIPCSWVYVDGVLNESETGFHCLGVVDPFCGNGSVSVFLPVVYTCERVISYLHTDYVV